MPNPNQPSRYKCMYIFLTIYQIQESGHRIGRAGLQQARNHKRSGEDEMGIRERYSFDRRVCIACI